MRRLGITLLSSLFVLVLGGVCLATDTPRLTGVFNDDAKIISAAKRAEITKLLQEQEAQTSNQIVVLVVKTMGGPDVDIAEYAGRVFNTWQLGHKGKDNGVLVTFARREGKMWITVGNGLQGVLPDLLAKRIVEGEEIQSLLKETKFGSALLATVKAIDREVHAEYKAEPKPIPVPSPKLVVERKETVVSEDGHAFGFFLLFIFLVVIVVVVYVLFFRDIDHNGDEYAYVPSTPPLPRSPRENYGGAKYRQKRRSHDSSSRPTHRQDDDYDGILTGVIIGSS
ncbi:TPM domain-containing protein, partial [Candidatus Kaiserbacteria bacterium]|nr:TPM domain-containing protein [Candidatus Kaiserbacteria bacterium]